MNSFELKNIKIFNLVEMDNSCRTIYRVYSEVKNRSITADDIFEILGNTNTAIKLVNDFNRLDDSFFSLYCLYAFDMNLLIIERLRKSFNNLNDMANNFELLDNLRLHEHTTLNIKNALFKLGLTFIINIKNEIINEIKENEPIQNYLLKAKILNKYDKLEMSEYDNIIDELIETNVICEYLDGFRLQKIYIIDYLLNSKEPLDKFVISRLKGDTLQTIAVKLGITREGVRQNIERRIREYPVFQNEEKYFKILNMYKLDAKEKSLIGLSDELLIEYISIKYKLKPKKTAFDYVDDLNLIGTVLGEQIFNNHNLTYIEDEIINKNYIDLFKKFIKLNCITSFNLNSVKDDYNKFLEKYNIVEQEYYIGDEKDEVIKSRKLENNSYFLNIYKDRFIVYIGDQISYDLIDELEDYLNNFKGYSSMSIFFNNNLALAEKNKINDEYELFAVAKRIFSKQFKDKIEFIRNPIIATKHLNRETYITNLILDMDLPCNIDDYLDHVENITGIHRNTIMGNYGRYINKYRNSDGLISLDDEITTEQYDYILSILLEKKCVGYQYFYDIVELKFGEDAHKILNSNNLNKIGFVKTNTSIYSNEFSNRLDAVCNTLSSVDDIIYNDIMLYRISDLEYYHYKNYDFIDSCYLLKIGPQKYLDLNKRGQSRLVKQMKIDLFNSLNNDEIYVLKEFVNSRDYIQWCNMNEEYKDLLNSFDTFEVLKDIITSMRNLNYIIQGNSLIFSKCDLSLKVILDNIINEYEILPLYELKEILYNQYGIEKNFTNSELSDMGYYCPNSSERVYLSKEYYEKELEDYLNGNS